MKSLRLLRYLIPLAASSVMIACTNSSDENAASEKVGAPPHTEVHMPEGDGTGRLILFMDYRSIGQGLTGFYGPNNGIGFDANFMADVYYSVWSLDDVEIGGVRLSEKTKTVPLKPEGISLEAVYKGPAPEMAATCIIHPTPKSNGRKALIMQFWRAVPERADKTMGLKSYDEAAPALVSWPETEYPCADALQNLGDVRANAVWGPRWKELQAEARKTLD